MISSSVSLDQVCKDPQYCVVKYAHKHLSLMNQALEETHSGYYEQDGTQYPVTSVLYTTADNKIYGSGSDDLGDFTWTGS